MIANGIASSTIAARQHDVEAALQPGVEALQRHLVDVDDRQPVEILEPRAQRDELQDVGHHLDVDELAAGDLHQVEQLGVLLERQRDIQVIDPFALCDLDDLGERAEQRQSAVADVIAAGAIVDEADHLIARARGAAACGRRPCGRDRPAPAMRMRFRPIPARQRRSSSFAHGFARRVGEHPRQREEQAPDDLRDLIGALRARRAVGRRSRRRRTASRATPKTTARMLPMSTAKKSSTRDRPRPQPVDALQPEGERRQHGDKRQQIQILLERRVAAVTGIRPLSKRMP